MATSIRKSEPNEEKLSLKKALKSANGTAILLAELSMLVTDMFLTIPLTIGTTRKIIASRSPITMIKANAADIHPGIYLPFICIFLSSFTIGLAISDTTTATNIYAIISQKNQHKKPTNDTAAAIIMHLASLSTSLLLCSIRLNYLILVFSAKLQNN